MKSLMFYLIGKGIYFSFDAEYCVRWYGRKNKGKGADGSICEGLALMVFAAVFGNSYLVTERVTTKCRHDLAEWQEKEQEFMSSRKSLMSITFSNVSAMFTVHTAAGW